METTNNTMPLFKKDYVNSVRLPNGFFNNAGNFFINLEVPKSNPLRKMPVDSTFRAIYNSEFLIFMDNHKAQSHNINIDSPLFTCFALTQREAIEKMMQSDFQYKNYPIFSIKNIS